MRERKRGRGEGRGEKMGGKMEERRGREERVKIKSLTLLGLNAMRLHYCTQ